VAVRTVPCDPAMRAGRLERAEGFWTAAELVREELPEVFVSNAVSSGIASADVICCAALGKHARGEGHDEAVTLLREANPQAAKHLSTLLPMKTKSTYMHQKVSKDDVTRADRAAEALLDLARVVG
jgi:phosphosulfolactate phosphohydrolase-like enzyme